MAKRIIFLYMRRGRTFRGGRTIKPLGEEVSSKVEWLGWWRQWGWSRPMRAKEKRKN